MGLSKAKKKRNERKKELRANQIADRELAAQNAKKPDALEAFKKGQADSEEQPEPEAEKTTAPEAPEPEPKQEIKKDSQKKK